MQLLLVNDLAIIISQGKTNKIYNMKHKSWMMANYIMYLFAF